MAQARAASNGGRDAKEDFHSLRADLDTLRQDFGTLVNTLKTNASSRAEAELDAVRQRVASLANDLQTTGQQQLRAAEGKIEERPFMSVAIAFATRSRGRAPDRSTLISRRRCARSARRAEEIARAVGCLELPASVGC